MRFETVTGRHNRDIAVRRADLARAWQAYQNMPRSGDGLNRPILHFGPGTNLTIVDRWFRKRHEELTSAEVPIVRILAQGRLRAARHVHVARLVEFREGMVLTDGIERHELAGKTIVGVKWLASSGLTRSDGSVPLRGIINGVYCSAFGQQVPVTIVEDFEVTPIPPGGPVHVP